MEGSFFTTAQAARLLKVDGRRITAALAAGQITPDATYAGQGGKPLPLFRADADRLAEIDEVLRHPGLAQRYVDRFEASNPGLSVGEMELGRRLIARTKPANELAEQQFARYKREHGTIMEFIRRKGAAK